MQAPRQCRPTPACFSTSARVVVSASVRKPVTAAFSAVTARFPALRCRKRAAAAAPECRATLPVLNKLKGWAQALKRQVITLWFCRSHRDTPLAAKLLAGLVVAYAFSPIDLIPDFIPILGYLDDLLIVPLGIWLALRMIPPHVITASRGKAEAWMARQEERPKNLLAAAVVVSLWLALAFWAWSAFSA